MRKIVILLCFYLGTAFSAPPELVTQVIKLDYVQANNIITELKPFLLPGEVLSGKGNMLLLRVSYNTLNQLKLMIQAIDVPPVVFTVSIQQGNAEGLGNNDSTVYSATSRTESGNAQSVNVLNGHSAFVSMGSDRPIISSVSGGFGGNSGNNNRRGRGGNNRGNNQGDNRSNNNNDSNNTNDSNNEGNNLGWGDQGVTYEQKEEKQGFYIKPVLEGDKVKITINRTRQQVSPTNYQASDNQALSTITVIPLNKWVKLGQTGQADTGSQPKTINYQATNSYANDTVLYIKITKQH